MDNRESKIILALDFADEQSVYKLVDQIKPSQCKLKVGKELFTRYGPEIVRQLVKRDFDVFLDLKYHDIPNTVAQACLAAADLGVWMLNVHALGGQRMMAAAREALDNVDNPPLLIAVTILTSMDDSELSMVGISGNAADAANRLAILAHQEGLDGVVCSAMEAERMQKQFGPEYCLVTPGIRLEQDARGDQRRVMTPTDAINAGSHYLVIGRTITRAENPYGKLIQINEGIPT
jgi:orotidine-5'-phosphate decarboxylase